MPPVRPLVAEAGAVVAVGGPAVAVAVADGRHLAHGRSALRKVSCVGLASSSPCELWVQRSSS